MRKQFAGKQIRENLRNLRFRILCVSSPLTLRVKGRRSRLGKSATRWRSGFGPRRPYRIQPPPCNIR